MVGKVNHCWACQAPIVWGIKNAKPHPYNAAFDNKGRVHHGTSHMSTCAEIEVFLPKHHKTLYARADRCTADFTRWRKSCFNSSLMRIHKINWGGISVYDVPEKHAIRIAFKLSERGGPFPTRHPEDLLQHFKAIAVRNKLVMWVMLRNAIYNQIHCHLHGWWLSVFTDMSERAPVKVEKYQLEPISVLPTLPYNQVRNFSLAESYTL